MLWWKEITRIIVIITEGVRLIACLFQYMLIFIVCDRKITSSMTRTILIIFFSGLLVVYSEVNAQNQPVINLSLEQCIEKAWKNNLQLRQQQLSVEIAEENLVQSKAAQLPNLNASATHIYNFGRTIDLFTNEFATNMVLSNNFSLSSGVNLFSGFQVQNTIRQNELELEAGKFDLEKSYNDVALMVASAYLQILFSNELVSNVSNQIEITRLQVERTNKLVDAGTLPRGALLTVQAQLATEELQLVNARNQLDLAYLNLRQILFLTEEEAFTIDIPEIEIDIQEEYPYSPLQVYRIAVGEQPQIRSSELRIGSAERALAIARGSRSPMLSLRGSFGTGYSGAQREITDVVVTGTSPIGATELGEIVYGPQLEYTTRVKPFSDQLRDNLNQSVGLFLSIPIFNNYQINANISRSRIGLENARLQNQIAKEQLFQTIQQAHADASAAMKRYIASDKNVLALQESFRHTQQRFDVGMVNSIEFNDAKNRLAAAQSELLQAKYEYIFRVKILDFYMGEPLKL